MYPLFDELSMMPDSELRDLYFEMSRFLVESDFDVSDYFRNVFDEVINLMAVRFAHSRSVSNWDMFFGEYHEFITV